MRYNNTMFPNDREAGIIYRAGSMLRRNQAENTGSGRMLRNAQRILAARNRMLKGLGNANG